MSNKQRTHPHIKSAWRGGEGSARKLSVRTNESSPFARLSPTLMAPPMLRCLPHIIKLAQASGNLCVSFFLCLLRACVCACVCVCFTDAPWRGLQQRVPHWASLFLILPLSTAKMTECNAAHERKKRNCIVYSYTLYTHTHSGKEGATSSAELYLSEICTCQWRSKMSWSKMWHIHSRRTAACTVWLRGNKNPVTAFHTCLWSDLVAAESKQHPLVTIKWSRLMSLCSAPLRNHHGSFLLGPIVFVVPAAHLAGLISILPT